MSSAALEPLAENTGLAFSGEAKWPAAILTARQLKILRSAANPSGRPNADVLRGFLTCSGGRLGERWQIDFAPYLTSQEAALYEAPFALLKRKSGREGDVSWWVNPRAGQHLRTALAKLDRFLVTAVAARQPAWSWVDAGWLPDDSLAAVARDDDFAQGVLSSRIFEVWWRDSSPGRDVVRAVETFPFPWSVTLSFGALTGLQQEMRAAIARAARQQDTVQLDALVVTAYGWPSSLDEGEFLSRLRHLHLQRAAAAK